MLPTSILSVSSRQREGDDSLNSIAYRQIKEKIVTLELPPASMIDEERLANQMKIGLTPVRQALRRLALENLVVILPRRGTMVADLNLADLQKIFELRIELETLAARLAAQRATSHQIAEMEAVAQDALIVMLTADNQTLMMFDHQLHVLLAKSAHNEFLEETLERLFSHSLRLWNTAIDRVAPLGWAIQEHLSLVKSVKSGNAERAATIMHEHVTRFQQELLKS